MCPFNDFTIPQQTDTVVGGVSGSLKLETARGPVAIADLRAGDKIMTADTGLTPLVGLQRLSPSGDDRPLSSVIVAQGVLGAERDIILASDQPVLLKNWLCNALFSRPEVLAKIGAFTNGVHVVESTEAPATLYRLAFEKPQIICAEGLWVSCPSQEGHHARPFLSPQEQSAAAESGLFTRRPGELHARTAAR